MREREGISERKAKRELKKMRFRKKCHLPLRKPFDVWAADFLK